MTNKFCPFLADKNTKHETLKQCNQDCALYVEKLAMCSFKAIAQAHIPNVSKQTNPV